MSSEGSLVSWSSLPELKETVFPASAAGNGGRHQDRESQLCLPPAPETSHNLHGLWFLVFSVLTDSLTSGLVVIIWWHCFVVLTITA